MDNFFTKEQPFHIIIEDAEDTQFVVVFDKSGSMNQDNNGTAAIFAETCMKAGFEGKGVIIGATNKESVKFFDLKKNSSTWITYASTPYNCTQANITWPEVEFNYEKLEQDYQTGKITDAEYEKTIIKQIEIQKDIDFSGGTPCQAIIEAAKLAAKKGGLLLIHTDGEVTNQRSTTEGKKISY